MRLSSTRSSSWTQLRGQVSFCFKFSAKYTLDGLNKQKNEISKIVAQKKKESKGQDKCEEEIAQSKSIDDKIAEQKKITAEAIE